MLGRLWSHRVLVVCAALATVMAVAAGQAAGQAPAKPGNSSVASPAPPQIPTGVAAPPDYLIGADDVLQIIFWREKDMSVEAAVRPDGKISLPLINEIQAAGLTPEQLRANITQAAPKFSEDPTVAVVIKIINSRKVFITGQINKPGPYPLMQPLTVLQLITTAGGVLEFADAENIGIVRTVNGKPTRFRFNYKEVSKGKKLEQNIELKPGDQVIVP